VDTQTYKHRNTHTQKLTVQSCSRRR